MTKSKNNRTREIYMFNKWIVDLPLSLCRSNQIEYEDIVYRD